MTDKTTYNILTFFIAAVWLVNGLVCKVLNLVPRHEQIVARILGSDHSRTLTVLIGLSEIVMVVWILTRFKPKLNAVAQMTVVATMNVLEFVLVPDLLLWGRLNALFAFLFILLVYYHEFVLHRKLTLQEQS
jgi:DoxX-like family